MYGQTPRELMAQEVLFVHSAGKQGKEEGSYRLIEYLQRKLGGDYHLIVPLMPDPENPRFGAWAKEIKSVMQKSQGDLLIIGHSLGGSVLLKHLSESTTDKNIKAIFLVATPFWGSKDWQIEEFELRRDFVHSLPPFSKIFLYHSKGDEWVPVQHMIMYAQQFPQATLRMLEGDEHEFYNGLPELVNDIKNL